MLGIKKRGPFQKRGRGPPSDDARAVAEPRRIKTMAPVDFGVPACSGMAPRARRGHRLPGQTKTQIQKKGATTRGGEKGGQTMLGIKKRGPFQKRGRGPPSDDARAVAEPRRIKTMGPLDFGVPACPGMAPRARRGHRLPGQTKTQIQKKGGHNPGRGGMGDRPCSESKKGVRFKKGVEAHPATTPEL